MNPVQQKAAAVFLEAFGLRPDCVSFAPGRAELLGNHTELSGGCVLSVALDQGVAVAAARIPGFAKRIEVHSGKSGETVKSPLEPIVPVKGSWADYPMRVIEELARSGSQLKGTRLAVVSDLPLERGSPSSAALGLATAAAIYELYGGRPRQPMEEARLCQRAEASFSGRPCGMADPFCARFGKKDHALFLDASTLRYQQVALGRDDIRLVILGSGEEHELVEGECARLRGSSVRAAKRFDEVVGHEVRFLRDVSLAEFQTYAGDIEDEDRPRAEHIIRENERVLRGLAALKTKSFEELRRLMLESHASSRSLLGNSTPALDFLVEAASSLPGFLGGKLDSLGFGGSTVNLVEAGLVDSFTAEVSARFEKKFSRRLLPVLSGIGDGVRVETAARLELR